MATQEDLDLARRLLKAGVLDEGQIRSALEVQGQLLQKGKQVSLERVIYARKDLPDGALAPLHAPPLVESQPFTNYELSREIGEGGVGNVFSGVYVPNTTPVAVKVLDPVQALRELFRDRFQREANLHIELEHDNIVAGYELGNEGGYHYYTMDLVEGVTVLEVIERRGFLECEEALSITVQAAYALSYLHSMGLVHRDMKPGNIMVEPSGYARLIDLGLAGAMGAEGEEAAQATTTVGTVEYVSPEQARGRTDLDGRTDLYSLGITLYHMVVGEVPFHGETDYEVMAKQILKAVDAQKIKQRRITPEVYFLIAKLAAKDRDERYASANEAIEILEGYLPRGIVPIDVGVEPSVQPTGSHVGRSSGTMRPVPNGTQKKGAPTPRRRRRR